MSASPDGLVTGARGERSASRWPRVLGIAGIAAALPFFAWLPLGQIDAVPSMVDVFAVQGLRTPAPNAVLAFAMTVIGLGLTLREFRYGQPRRASRRARQREGASRASGSRAATTY